MQVDTGGVLGKSENLRLDGEHAPSASSLFPSGDGNAGGDFQFHFRVLPGDFNRSGSAAINDLGGARRGLGSQVGGSNYSICADTNASGQIAVNDITPLRQHLGKAAPALPAASVAAVPVPTNSLSNRDIDAVMAAMGEDETETNEHGLSLYANTQDL